MRKMTETEMREMNGGAHYAYCVKCNKLFKGITLKKVKQAATAHCYANGGPSKGHRYTVLY